MITWEVLEPAVKASLISEEYIGFCLECDEEHYGVEPDAKYYKCGKCGAMAVCGAEMILAMEAFE